MSRYINPYTDFGFKKLFGEEANKDLLIDFLNSQLPEEHQIQSLEFRNAEQLGMTSLDRKTIYDIYCVGANGDHFIVEMQKASQRYFKDRALFWTTFLIQSQAPKGFLNGKPWDFNLKMVYLIAILGFVYDEDEEKQKFIRDVQLKDQDGELFYKKMHFRFLQMPLFTKTESELVTRSDKWHYFLKNLDSFNSIPSIFREPVFEQAFATAEIAAMSKDEHLQYHMSQMAQWDNYATLETAKYNARAKGHAEGRAEGHAEGRAEGHAEGRAEGRAKGRAEEKIEIARNMKRDGFDTVIITKMTGLSQEEIEKL